VKRKQLAAAAILALAAGIVLWRESGRPSPEPVAAKPEVVLFADLSEVDELGGCGSIIRAVRAAAKRGLATQEIDARDPSDLVARYRLLVAPTVVFLDGSGQETARFEGEAPEIVRAVLARLHQP